MFQINVGGIDRVLRIAIGVMLLSLAFVGPQTPLGLIGIIPLVTGIFRMCPIYSLFGITTCRKPK
ncbi:cadmium resistance protein CadD (predicted permease) [Altererythrobacter atlanticus]|uniref:Uncharacterized protein n=1 Tax=Croceibacterium atlanticum TaxID=1267766 RepID=A0A0F7KSI1_9SPHN|nr:DUF2892 domain-containing protein [Croceibacterium atlanticum]AKH42539.1 hypothetical protein WYH_01500 [Croceibacterium atlanticum]MBB5731316.1 cadmium resistance protein CadD (predicted permease) [Croceibacterium atlanticum]